MQINQYWSIYTLPKADLYPRGLDLYFEYCEDIQ